MFEWINDHPYTCPVLMALQAVVLRQKWRYGCDGWRVMAGPNHAATSCAPDWLIMLECRFWNSRVGGHLRRAAGTQQLDYRLQSL